MYRKNVGAPSESNDASRHLVGKIVNSAWRWWSRKWLYRQIDFMSWRPTLGRFRGYGPLVTREEQDESSQKRFQELPGAELTEEQRREAADEITRRPRIG
jgi:hypothetical protein